MALAGGSLVHGASSTSLGTDDSQPRKAQLRTLGLARQQLLQKPSMGSCCHLGCLLLLVFISQWLLQL